MKQSGVFCLPGPVLLFFLFRFAFDFGLERLSGPWRNGPQKSNTQAKSKKSIYGTWLSFRRSDQYQVPRSNKLFA